MLFRKRLLTLICLFLVSSFFLSLKDNTGHAREIQDQLHKTVTLPGTVQRSVVLMHHALDIAIGSGQSLFAVHHADAGHFTQIFHISSRKCHNSFSFIVLSEGRVRGPPLQFFNYSSTFWASSSEAASSASTP